MRNRQSVMNLHILLNIQYLLNKLIFHTMEESLLLE